MTKSTKSEAKSTKPNKADMAQAIKVKAVKAALSKKPLTIKGIAFKAFKLSKDYGFVRTILNGLVKEGIASENDGDYTLKMAKAKKTPAKPEATKVVKVERAPRGEKAATILSVLNGVPMGPAAIKIAADLDPNKAIFGTINRLLEKGLVVQHGEGRTSAYTLAKKAKGKKAA